MGESVRHGYMTKTVVDMLCAQGVEHGVAGSVHDAPLRDRVDVWWWSWSSAAPG